MNVIQIKILYLHIHSLQIDLKTTNYVSGTKYQIDGLQKRMGIIRQIEMKRHFRMEKYHA